MSDPVAPPDEADGAEAARLIDADASPVAAIRAPDAATEVDAFRDAVLLAALAHEGPTAVAGVLFASRWGGGGVMIT